MQSIKPLFLEYYTQLDTSEDPSRVEKYLYRPLEEKEQLSAPFTPDEVLQAIKSMPSGETPGLDRYNIEFYKAF